MEGGLRSGLILWRSLLSIDFAPVLDVDTNHPVEVALVSLDLVHSIAVQAHRTRDAILAVEVAHPVLRSLRLHQEGIALWRSLGDQIATGRAAEIRWKEIHDYYRRSWYKPVAFKERGLV